MVAMPRDLDRTVQRRLRQVLLLLAGLLLLACLLLVGGGLRQQHRLDTLVADRVQPLHDLQRLSHLMNVELLAVVSAPQLSSDARRPQIEALLARADRIWSAYLQTYLTAEEQHLASAAERQRLAIRRLLDVAPAADTRYALLVQLLNRDLSALLSLQVEVARRELEQGRLLQRLLWAASLLLLLGGALAFWWAWRTLDREVLRPLAAVADAVAGLAEGELRPEPGELALAGGYAEVAQQLGSLRRALAEPRLSEPGDGS